MDLFNLMYAWIGPQSLCHLLLNAENLDRWEDHHMQMLICCWKENKLFFGNGKSTKKEVF